MSSGDSAHARSGSRRFDALRRAGLPDLLGRYSPLHLIRGTSVGIAKVDEGLRSLESPSQIAGVRLSATPRSSSRSTSTLTLAGPHGRCGIPDGRNARPRDGCVTRANWGQNWGQRAPYGHHELRANADPKARLQGHYHGGSAWESNPSRRYRYGSQPRG